MEISIQQQKAFAKLLHRVIIHVRANSAELSPEYIYSVLNAVHNIPLFLVAPDEETLRFIKHDVRSFDSQFGDTEPVIKLENVLDSAGGHL